MSAAPERQPANEPTLGELAATANRRHALAEQAARAMALHGYYAGEALLTVKARLPHGQLGPWVEANCDFSERTARRYMWLARKTATVADLEGLSLSDAIRALQPEPEQEEREIPPLFEWVAYELPPARGNASAWRPAQHPVPLEELPAALAAHDCAREVSETIKHVLGPGLADGRLPERRRLPESSAVVVTIRQHGVGKGHRGLG